MDDLKKQIQALKHKKAFQLSKEQIANGTDEHPHSFIMNAKDEIIKKLKHAHKHGKGLRIKGGDIGSFLKEDGILLKIKRVMLLKLQNQ